MELPEIVDGLPNISGSEKAVEEAIARGAKQSVFKDQNHIDFGSIQSACAIALHMHQPMIPAGGHDLRTAALISNLKDMWDNQGIGDNHNAPVFAWCYKRMGEFIPQLIGEGKEPRVMLEYSGSLLYGLRNMGQHDVLDSLKRITMDHGLRRAVEWLGMPWGHAVAPSTPIQDFRLQVKAFQHHFAALFGMEAVGRLRGFSPSEMALPNHPDVAYEFVKTLRDCGFRWVLVQEHTVERPDGRGLERKHLPHLLTCTHSSGEKASIIAIVKTQGSDTKLVAQMQPYYEAKSLSRWDLAGKSVPPLVTQIADGENGGVMMNEFPSKYMEVVREASHSRIPLMNVTEYLEHLEGLGIKDRDFTEIQPLFQKRIWDRMKPGEGPEKLARTIADLKKEDGRFHMEGGSWTNNISWVRGYDNLIGPMEKVSSLFHEEMVKKGVPTSDWRYRNALFHLLNSQTSCYRYWGQGRWTDYGAEICRRAHETIVHK
jgi:glycosyl hydrolase family 57